MFAGKLHFFHEVSKMLISDKSKLVSVSLLKPGFTETDNFKIAAYP